MDKHTSNGILEDFRIEFLNCWQRLPNKGFFLALLAAWLALFQFLGNSTLGYTPTRSLMVWMYTVYNAKQGEAASDEGHANLIPFLVLALFWWKRKELLALELRAWWPGLALVGMGLGVHLVGFLAQQPTISIVGLFLGIYGLTGLAWGPAWLRASIFPFCLFVFSIPLGSLALPLSFRLRLLVCKLTEAVCTFFFSIDIIRDGTKLLDPGGKYQYDVAAACSGIRSLTAIILISVAYGFVSFRAYWKRALIILSAIPLAVLGNLFRMVLIILASEIGGRKWGEYIHSSEILSLLPYIPAIGGVLLLGHWLREPPDQSQRVAAVSQGCPGEPGHGTDERRAQASPELKRPESEAR